MIKEMWVGVSDKLVMPYVKDKEILDCSDEAESIAIGAGFWLATGKRANVFMSADGFANTINFLTSWIIPQNIEMNLLISTGRQEPSHKIMTDILSDLIKLLPYDPERMDIKIVTKQS